MFIPLEPNHQIIECYEHSLIHPIYSPDLKIWLGKWPVAFGYRLRGGYTTDLIGCNLDICCGPLTKFYDELFEKVIAIINKNGPANPFANIPPASVIKPYYNDIDFCNAIDSLFSYERN